MRLRELEAEFVRLLDARTFTVRDVTFATAQGVWFLCPKCYTANGGRVGTHAVLCWFADRGVPADMKPLPGRWHPAGTGIDDLTFVGPGATSVLLLSGCAWHGFVRDGDAT